jgi:glycerol uptake facilitator-like aquaporin
MFGRKKVAALVAEFLGTGVLTLLVLSVQRSQLGLQYFVALAAGLAIAVMTFVLSKSSGAYFNPAITLGLWTARKLSTVTGILYLIVQFLGAYAAYGLYIFYTNSHLTNAGGHYTSRILLAEAVGTTVFTFGWAATLSKANTQAAKAAFAGLSYTLGVLLASSAALGLLNPAVAFGIKAWVWGTYVLGPVLGAILGINLYTVLFAEKDDVDSNPITFATATASVSSSSTSSDATSKKAAPKKKASSKKK